MSAWLGSGEDTLLFSPDDCFLAVSSHGGVGAGGRERKGGRKGRKEGKREREREKGRGREGKEVREREGESERAREQRLRAWHGATELMSGMAKKSVSRALTWSFYTYFPQ